MPLTKKGRKIMRSMKEEYGPDRGEAVFYASKNKGVIKGVERKKDGGMIMGKKKYEEGGEVYLRVPMEPDEETMKQIEKEQAEKGISETDVKISEKAAGTVKRRGDDKSVKTYAMGGKVSAVPYRDGGMVRGCKGIQVTGKKFSGTF